MQATAEAQQVQPGILAHFRSYPLASLNGPQILEIKWTI
jgi:hypothetical protein